MLEPYFSLFTPSIRYDNIPKIYRSLKPFVNKYKFDWWICYDSWQPIYEPVSENWIHQFTYKEMGGIAGNHQRNYLLDQIQDGYCFSLDDDTIIHPDFFPVLSRCIIETQKRGFLFHDQLADDAILYARAGHIREGSIGNQNFAIHKSLIQMNRMNIHYCADGEFIEKMYKRYPDEFIIIDQVLAYHNRLLVRSDWENFLVKE